MDRSLAVEGLRNGRDLGGLRRGGGELTPTGVFFRSGSVDAVTARGWCQLRELGVRTVVDLRQDWERARDQGSRPAWLTTVAVDIDGLDNAQFWRDYWDNGLAGTPLYYLPYLAAMPERAGLALTAIVTAPQGGVLFHCMSGRDRTGLVAMLLLAAVDADPDEIVEDYLQVARDGAQLGNGRDHGAVDRGSEDVCRRHGTTREDAFRRALRDLNVDTCLAAAQLDAQARDALRTWRGTIALQVTEHAARRAGCHK